VIRAVADTNVCVVTINPIEVVFTKTAMKRARSTLLGWINGWKI
jgi:hypothetical protein